MQNNTHLVHKLWEPQEGCRLLHIPDEPLHGAQQMPYDDHKNVAPNSSIDEQRAYWLRCLEEKQNNIDRTKKYAGDEDVEWWEMFFTHQHTILDNYIASLWPIHIPFTWNIGVTSTISQTHHQPSNNIKLHNLVRPLERDIYVEPRKSRTVEARWQGNLQELQVGMLVATLVGDDNLGHSFWIAKIIELVKDEEGN